MAKRRKKDIDIPSAARPVLDRAKSTQKLSRRFACIEPAWLHSPHDQPLQQNYSTEHHHLHGLQTMLAAEGGNSTADQEQGPEERQTVGKGRALYARSTSESAKRWPHHPTSADCRESMLKFRRATRR